MYHLWPAADINKDIEYYSSLPSLPAVLPASFVLAKLLQHIQANLCLHTVKIVT